MTQLKQNKPDRECNAALDKSSAGFEDNEQKKTSSVKYARSQ